jgi:hypothetical protein
MLLLLTHARRAMERKTEPAARRFALSAGPRRLLAASNLVQFPNNVGHKNHGQICPVRPRDAPEAVPVR